MGIINNVFTYSPCLIIKDFEMGYTTDFEGCFYLSSKLTNAQFEFLSKFANTRRVCRDIFKLPAEGTHSKAGLPLGNLGSYYVDEIGFMGQGDALGSVVDTNDSGEQPGLWCKWSPTPCRERIEWDGGEKFYYYVEWIEYIIEHFLKLWGLSLDGKVKWHGEDSGDDGVIIVRNNVVTTEAR